MVHHRQLLSCVPRDEKIDLQLSEIRTDTELTEEAIFFDAFFVPIEKMKTNTGNNEVAASKTNYQVTRRPLTLYWSKR